MGEEQGEGDTTPTIFPPYPEIPLNPPFIKGVSLKGRGSKFCGSCGLKRIFMGEYILEIVLCIIAFGLIAKGADWFTESAVRIAEISRVPKVVIGATIVSVATSIPEFFVSVIAAFIGGQYCDMAVGNVIGSNSCNIGLALGSCVLIKSFFTHPRLSLQQGIIMLGCGGLLWLLTVGGEVSRWGGLLLVGLLLIYIFYSIRVTRAKRQITGFSQETASEKTLIQEIGWFILGGVCLVIGSRILISSGAKIASALGVSRLIISLSLIAIGTSLPEWITVFASARKGHPQLAVGCIMGSNIVNILWILGTSALIRGLPIQPQTKNFDLPVMLGLSLLLVIFSTTKNKLAHWEGGILLAGYIAYLTIMFTYFR